MTDFEAHALMQEMAAHMIDYDNAQGERDPDDFELSGECVRWLQSRLAGAAPVEAAKIPAGWQPIETAPREIIKQLGGQGYGAYILASNGFDVVRCRWWQHVDGSRNFIKDGGLSFHATHWMNLPAAPAPGEAQ